MKSVGKTILEFTTSAIAATVLAWVLSMIVLVVIFGMQTFNAGV